MDKSVMYGAKLMTACEDLLKHWTFEADNEDGTATSEKGEIIGFGTTLDTPTAALYRLSQVVNELKNPPVMSAMERAAIEEKNKQNFDWLNDSQL